MVKFWVAKLFVAKFLVAKISVAKILVAKFLVANNFSRKILGRKQSWSQTIMGAKILVAAQAERIGKEGL